VVCDCDARHEGATTVTAGHERDTVAPPFEKGFLLFSVCFLHSAQRELEGTRFKRLRREMDVRAIGERMRIPSFLSSLPSYHGVCVSHAFPAAIRFCEGGRDRQCL
jgi:hypothetical protein